MLLMKVSVATACMTSSCSTMKAIRDNYPPTEVQTGSSLPERPHDLIANRLDEIGDHRPLAGLDEAFDRHAGNKRHAFEAGDLLIRNRDAHGEIACAGKV